MIISQPLEYVFVSNPKTGTHSLYQLLQSEFYGTQLEGRYHENRVPDHLQDHFCFTTCRHPISRFVSAFNVLTRDKSYKDIFLDHAGGDDFLSFARWASTLDNRSELIGKGFAVLTLQSAWLKDVKIDQFVRIEQANEDFERLPFVNHSVEVPKLLARKHETWDDLRCEESEALLREWLAPEFDFLPYEFDSV